MDDRDPTVPMNRQQLVEALAELRQQGAIDPYEEDTLMRHYDDLLREVDEEKARLEPEYVRRCNEDGQEAANQWLTEAAAALGRKHAEATRQVTDRLQVVTGGAPAG